MQITLYAATLYFHDFSGLAYPQNEIQVTIQKKKAQGCKHPPHFSSDFFNPKNLQFSQETIFSKDPLIYFHPVNSQIFRKKPIQIMESGFPCADFAAAVLHPNIRLPEYSPVPACPAIQIPFLLYLA